MNNIQLVQNVYAAFKEGSMDKFAAQMSDDLVWTEMRGTRQAGTHHGVAAVMENVMGPIAEEYNGDFAAVPDEFIDGGESIVVLGTYTGTVRENGNKLVAPFAHIWKLGGGKIRSFNQFTDAILINEAFEGV